MAVVSLPLSAQDLVPRAYIVMPIHSNAVTDQLSYSPSKIGKHLPMLNLESPNRRRLNGLPRNRKHFFEHCNAVL
jgi:hypothetical protein